MAEAAKEPCCSFCGKSRLEVRKLIAGPEVYICDECIGLCLDILTEEGDARDLLRATADAAIDRENLADPEREDLLMAWLELSGGTGEACRRAASRAVRWGLIELGAIALTRVPPDERAPGDGLDECALRFAGGDVERARGALAGAPPDGTPAEELVRSAHQALLEAWREGSLGLRAQVESLRGAMARLSAAELPEALREALFWELEAAAILCDPWAQDLAARLGGYRARFPERTFTRQLQARVAAARGEAPPVQGPDEGGAPGLPMALMGSVAWSPPNQG